MAMADGYAMASRSLGVVNLHISCGLGNAMGMLYNAFREGTPLLVTAGQQDRRLKFQEPILWGDMVVGRASPGPSGPSKSSASKTCPRRVRRAVQIGAGAAHRAGVSVDPGRRADGRTLSWN